MLIEEESKNILHPYARGDWLKTNEVKRETSKPSTTQKDDTASNGSSEGLPEKDLVLRGPIWNYNRTPHTTDEEHYDQLLFKRLRASLIAQDELILKGEPWQPSRPIKRSFIEYFFQFLKRKNPESVALLEAETGRTLKFGELMNKARSLSAGLRWIGLMPGQVVAIVSYNSLEAVLVLLATMLSAGVPAPVDSTLNPVELGAALRVVRPRLVFTEGGKTQFKVEAALGYLMTQRLPQLIINTRRTTRHWTVDRLMREQEPLPAEAKGCRFQRPVLILFTSGASSTGKAALIPEGYFTNNKLFVDSKNAMRKTTSHTCLATGPLFWTTPLYSLLFHVSQGDRVVFFRGAPPVSVVVDSFHKYQVYVWYTGPTTLIHLLHWPVRPRVPALKMVYVSGAIFPLSSFLQVRDQLFENKVHICPMYGRTEVGILVESTHATNKPGSIGKLFYNVQLKVIDKETGLTLGPNEEGQLCFKNPNMMLGYYNNPDAPAHAFDSEGFLLSGDLGYYDEEGWVYFTERQKDLIKWRSYQVPPSEVEAHLLLLPAVKEAVVVGIPDELDGERVAAAVVLKTGYDIPPVYLEHFANGHLSENKRIRGGVHLFPHLPHKAAGKPIRPTIRQMIMSRILDHSEDTESIYRARIA